MLKTAGVWTLTILLALFFLYVSYKKLTGNEITAAHFQEWGYANWLLTFVGCLELTGAILLLFPVTATSGALLLSLIMVGASYTLLSHDVRRTSIVTITCLVLLLFLGFVRWSEGWILSIFKMKG
ncbi:MAG TPA: DoxX family protein [Mucilaginibacter sp.]|jgi:uncharacterized membrane protein YphA (DoxX/SURF4 family)